MQRDNNRNRLAKALLLALVLTILCCGATVIKYGYPYIFGDGWVMLGENTSYPGRLSAYEQSSAPSGTVTDRWDVYPKSDGWYQQSDAGAEDRLATASDIAGFIDGTGSANFMAYFTDSDTLSYTDWEIAANNSTVSDSGTSSLRLGNTTGQRQQITGYSAIAGSALITGGVYGESFDRVRMTTNGTVQFGPGSAALDTTIARTSGAGIVAIGGEDQGDGTVRFYEDNDNGSNYFGVAAGDSRTTTQDVIWPDDSPSDGDFLEWNTGGQLEWTAGGGGSSPLTTKGDLYTYDTADARLAVGTNGYALTPDSAQALGIKWAAPFTLQGDLGTPQTLLIGDTIDVAGGDGIGTTGGATDTVTVAVDRTVARDYGTKTSSTTVGNSNSKDPVFSWTVAADEWEAGTQCQLVLYFKGTAFTGSPNLTCTVEDGTNTLATYSFNGLSSGQFGAQVMLSVTCRSTGASGTVESVGIAQATTSGMYWSDSNVDTIDTTGSNTYTVYLQWSAISAFNTVTVTSAGVLRLD